MRTFLALVAVLLPVVPAARGGHDSVGCAGCHSTHAARGEALFAVPPNTKLLDPRTGRANEPVTALCLGCHADAESGGRGIAPISNHFPHPYSRARVDGRLAQVPPELLRGGRFECVACHDPHPSNPNYRYLRLPVRAAPTLGELCVACHPRKADRGAPPPPLFSSMDERAPEGTGAPR